MSIRCLTSVGALIVLVLGFSACGGGFWTGDHDEEGQAQTREQRASTECSVGDRCGTGQFCVYDSCDDEVGSCESIDSFETTPEECYTEGPDPVCGCNDRVYYNQCMAELSVDGPYEDGSECTLECQDGEECPEGQYCHLKSGTGCSPDADSKGVCVPQPGECPDPQAGHLGVCGCDGEVYESACRAREAGASVDSGIPGLSCGDGAPPDLTEICVSDAWCESDEYCRKYACNSEFGSCETVPSSCDGSPLRLVCGCNGTTYASECEARSKGVTTTTLEACLLQCELCNLPNPPSYCPESGSAAQTKARVVEGRTSNTEPKVTGELYKWPPLSTPNTTGESGDNRNYEWVDTQKRPPAYSARTFPRSSSSGYDSNLHYDRYTGACKAGVGSEIKREDSNRWYRIELRKEGYEPYFTYRRHDYDDECTVPDYGGTCSKANCDSEAEYELQCTDWGTFEMWEHDEERLKLPDLFPDPRAPEDGPHQTSGHNIECVDLDGDQYSNVSKSDADVFGLRVRVSIANVGSGPLHVERPPIGTKGGHCPCPKGYKCKKLSDDEKTCVAKSCDPGKDPSKDVCPRDMICRDVQGDGQEECALITCDSNSDCSQPDTNGECLVRGECKQTDDICREDSDCPYRCEEDEAQDVCEPTTTQVIQRVERTDPWTEAPSPKREDVDSEIIFHQPHNHHHLQKFASAKLVNDSGNEVATTEKISFNISDTDPFDDEILNEVQKNSDAPWSTNVSYDQGITPGWKDEYDPSVPGQGMILGTQNMVEGQSSSNPHTIVVKVDPEGTLTERTSSNNEVQVNYTFPNWSNNDPFCDKSKDDVTNRGCGSYDPKKESDYHVICERYLCWYCNNPEVDDDPDEKGSNLPLCDELPSDACKRQGN